MQLALYLAALLGAATVVSAIPLNANQHSKRMLKAYGDEPDDDEAKHSKRFLKAYGDEPDDDEAKHAKRAPVPCGGDGHHKRVLAVYGNCPDN